MKKEECLNLLRDNKMFKDVLSKASNDVEKNSIKTQAEVFVMKFFEDVIEPLEVAMKNDPNSINKLFQEISDALIKSGSTEI